MLCVVFLSGEHSAGGHDVLAARGTDSGGYALTVQPVAKFDHSLAVGRTKWAVGDGVETDEVDTAIHIPQKSGKGIAMTVIVVESAPHYIFNREAPLVGEVVKAEDFEHLAGRVGFFYGHKFLPL